MAEMDMFSYTLSFDDIVIPFDDDDSDSEASVAVAVAVGVQPGGLEYDDSDTEEYVAFHAHIAFRELLLHMPQNP
jgi:hypothetical protein